MCTVAAIEDLETVIPASNEYSMVHVTHPIGVAQFVVPKD
jgi:hypothetical protein